MDDEQGYPHFRNPPYETMIDYERLLGGAARNEQMVLEVRMKQHESKLTERNYCN